MYNKHLLKCSFTIILLRGFSFILASPIYVKESDGLGCPTPYKEIIHDLRDNWQSPIMYLKMRGYIPKNSDSLVRENDECIADQPLELSKNAKRGSIFDRYKDLIEVGPVEKNVFNKNWNLLQEIPGVKSTKQKTSFDINPIEEGVLDSNGADRNKALSYTKNNEDFEDPFEKLLNMKAGKDVQAKKKDPFSRRFENDA